MQWKERKERNDSYRVALNIKIMLKIKMGISCDMFAFICESMAFLVSNQKRTKRGKQRTVKPHILINNLTF